MTDAMTGAMTGTMTGVLTRLFISHSSRDAPFIRERILPLFEGQPIAAWCSSLDMRVAADWQRQIQSALEQTDWFIVILSPDAEQSEWVQAETHWALEHMRGRVIPLLSRACDPAKVHLRLGTIQYLDFREDPVRAGQQLLALIRAGQPVDDLAPRAAAHPDAQRALSTVFADYRQAILTLSIQDRTGASQEKRLLVRDWAILGRAADTDLPFDDRGISRRHARVAIVRANGGLALTLSDLDSANGTFVNQARIARDHPLTVGDLIELGGTRLRVLAIDAV